MCGALNTALVHSYLVSTQDLVIVDFLIHKTIFNVIEAIVEMCPSRLGAKSYCDLFPLRVQ